MNKDLQRIIEVPEGISVKNEGMKVKISNSGKEVEKEFHFGKISMKSEAGKVILSAKNATRRESKMLGTIWAHLKNMIKGLNEEFVYKLEVCNVHFPMNLKLEGNKVTIKSFLGETTTRTSKILPEAKVEINGSQITVSSHDIEAAGQTAANLEKATRLTGRDRRIFQDGIFITEKCGRAI